VGGVIIATSTATSSPVLQLEDLPYDSSSIIVGQYYPLEQKIKFQPYGMGSTTDSALWNKQTNVATHELGHALGLWHSYLSPSGNMMNSYVTGTTTLGSQDRFDYNYCWAGGNNVCRQ
jgi:predicted Zn-dependent protease